MAGTEIVKAEAAPATLFGTHDPAEIVKAATAQATALKDVIEANKLYAEIPGKRGQTKKHVYVQGWTFLGSMLGVHPVTVWTKRMTMSEDGVDGWEARVEARTRSGDIVGAAEAMCTRDEDNWGDRDEYAIRSMAQTRATSKALRQPLDFVMQLAGFDATPAEEVPPGGFHDTPRAAGPPCPSCGSRLYDNNADVDREIEEKKKNGEKPESNKPRWRCSNKDGCTGGSNGRPWASWERNPFGISEEAANNAAGDENVRLIHEAITAGETTKAKVIATARRVAKSKEPAEPQITDIAQLGLLSSDTRREVAQELNLAAVDVEPEPEEPTPAKGSGACSRHDSYDDTCADCRWIRHGAQGDTQRGAVEEQPA
jgi:hypothetical protein